MLTISIEKVCEIIDMAYQANGKVTPVEEPPPADPGDDAYIDAIQEFADDPSSDLLRQTLENLYNDEKADLLALIWLGAGDVFPELNFDEMQTRAAEEIQRQNFVDRVINRPLLGDELADALDALGYSCEED